MSAVRCSVRSAQIARHLLSVVFAAALVACGGGGGDTTQQVQASSTQRVSIDFALADTTGVLAAPCAQPLQGMGSNARLARLHDARFYVANVHLVTRTGGLVKLTMDGNTEQLSLGPDSVALVDLRDATGCASGAGTGHKAITGTVVAGDYVGAQITLGVPEALNHVDPNDSSLAPLDNTDMGWDWTGGKKHLLIELDPQASGGGYVGGIALAGGGTASRFSVHLGNTCTSRQETVGGTTRTVYECSIINTRDIRFAAFDPARERIVVDLASLLAGNDLTVDAGGAIGCMSDATDPECLSLWPALGGATVSGSTQALGLATTWQSSATTTFRVAPK